MIEFSITLQSNTTLEDEQHIREKLLASVWNTLIDNGQSNAIVGTSVIAESVPLTTEVDNVKKIVGTATVAEDGTITAVITDDETWDKIKYTGPMSIEHGMVHYPAHKPKTTAPTGACGQMGFALELSTDVDDLTCPQCIQSIEGKK